MLFLAPASLAAIDTAARVVACDAVCAWLTHRCWGGSSASEHGDERAASIALLPDLAHFDTHLLEGDSGDLFQVAVAGVSSNAQPRDAPFVLASSRQDAVEERATVVGAASSDSRGARARPRTAKRTSAGGAPAPSDSFPGRLDAWGFDDLSGIERAIPELVPAVAERRTWRPDSTRPGTARTNASHSRPNTSGRPSTCNSSVLSAAPTPRPPSNGTRKQSAPRASRRPMTARGQHGGQGLHAASNRRPTTARHSVTTRVGTPPQPSHALADDVLSWSDAVDEDISELLLDLGRERVPSAPTWTRPGKAQRFNENSNSITVGPVECGSVLPRVWSRPTTPQARKGELNADTFKRAEKVTHIQMPKARVDHYPRPPKPASGLKWKAVGEDGQKRPGKGRELTYSSKDKSAPSKLAAALEKKMRLQNSRAAVDEIAFDEAEWDGIWDDSGLFIDHFIKVGEGKAALFFQPALVERPPDRALKGTGKLNWGGGQTRTSGSPLHGSSAPGSPQRATYGSSHKSSYAKDEKLVGVHIKKADLKKDETQVVYSNQYRALKGLDDDSKEILEKGTGVVTGWDPDGMMVDVLWENGEIEYCCTGFCHKFHLALKVIVDDKTGHLHLQGWEDPNKKLMEKCRDYPSWDVGGDGIEWAQQNNVLEAVSLVPKTVCGVVKCMDIWDELAQQKRVKAIIKELSAAGKDAKVYQRALENSRKSVERLEKDHAVMNDWIVAKLGDEEFKIPPSSLAPPAPSTVSSCNWARPSILQEVKKQVKIDVETAKRQARFEAEAEKERIRLERKTLKIGKDPGGHKAKELAEAKARNEHRAARLKLDPWDAVLTVCFFLIPVPPNVGCRLVCHELPALQAHASQH